MVKIIKNVLLYGLVAILIMYNVCILTSRLILKENLPTFLGYAPVMVMSGSMEPEFSKNDILVIKKVSNYFEGDVVTYSKNSYLVTHRIIRIEDKIILKGDANNTEDEPIELYQIQGKVICVIPFVGDLINFLKVPMNLLITVIVIMIIGTIYSTNKQKTKERELKELYDKLKEMEKKKGNNEIESENKL